MASNVATAAVPMMLTSGASVRAYALFSPRVLRTFLTAVINAVVLVLFFPFRRTAATARVPSERAKEERERGRGVVRVPAAARWKSCSAEVAARRAVAVRRVMQGGSERCVRGFSFFGTNRGQTLFTQSWTPVDNDNIRGVVIILHGLNEHGDRYDGFAKELTANSYNVYAMDWIGLEWAELEYMGFITASLFLMIYFIGYLGHGGSDGLHAYVHSLDDAVLDMKTFISKVVAKNPRLPCFCFGHSTGAAIILKAVLDPKIEACVAGVVLTSPAVGVQPSHSALAVLAPVFSFLLPRYQLSAANKQGALVSRDPDAIAAKYSDPLVYTGSIRIRTGYEILRITAFLQQNLRRLRIPFLVLHGTADSITDPKASQKLYDEASSTDKSIRLLDGLLHDLLFEPEREMIVGEIINWFNSRI